MLFPLTSLNNFVFVLLRTFMHFESICSINEELLKTTNNMTFSDFTDTATMVTEIIKICQGDNLDKVVLAGDWTDFQIWHRYFPTNMTFKIFGTPYEKLHIQHRRGSGLYKLNEAIVKKLYYPAKLFVIIATNHQVLEENIALLKKSIIWDSRAFFIVIEKSHNNCCSEATISIEILWKYNILNAIYLCNDYEGKMNFYNFNPYTSHAIEPWQLIDEIIDFNRYHPISIFHLSTRVGYFNASFCKLLNFEKTTTIDNYPIKMSGAVSQPQFENISEIKALNFLEDFKGLDAKINKIIWNKLGANPTITIYSDGYVDSDHQPHGSIKEVINNKYDMGVNQFFSRNFWRLQTYPHSTGGIYAMTREIEENVDLRLMISEHVIFLAIFLVSLFTILALRYYFKTSITHAIAINFKLLIGIHTSYEASGGKKLLYIYLTFVNFSVSLFLQSCLSSSLVSPSKIFSIDSREDIIDALNLNYKVYGPPFVQEFLNERIDQSFHAENFTECVNVLELLYKSICLSDGFSIDSYIKDVEDIHVSEKKIKTLDYVFIVREDWPLRPRIDFITQQLRESGILYYFTLEALSTLLLHHDEHKNTKNQATFRHLSLKALNFSFYILSAGFIISFCVFAAERIRMKNNLRKGKNRHKLNNLNIFKQRHS